ncbi:MAG: hypothetical protein HYR55_09210 [Acidobacteria bacterium]|nr:hypothetical protein [Acidobacteriota bacterium]MBI3656661.1 hypothetical protein [Acidobacteriota bacterium]
MRKILTTIIMISLVLLAAIGSSLMGKSESKSVAMTTITGEVIDIACFMGHDASGKNHTKCAVQCAEKGIPLAILDEKLQQIYLPLALDHSSPNAKLLNYIAQRVTVTGRVIKKGGLTGIEIKSIEPAHAVKAK